MDVREKLVGIVCDPAQINGCIHRCNHPPCAMVGDIVDALIENGVTVQEWISVKDRLPEILPDKIAEGYVQIQVLVLCDKGRQCAWFQVDTKKFYDQDGWLGTEVDGVTHWMPLPQPPKGE